MLLGLVTVPYLVRHLGVEAFGILTLVWALIGYFSIFDFGIGRALTHQVSVLVGARRNGEMREVVRVGLALVAGFGLIGAVVLASLAPFLPGWLKVAPPLRVSTVECLLVAAIGIVPTTLVTGLRGVLEGLQDFASSNVLKVILGCATFGLPAAVIWLHGPFLVEIVIALVAARLAIALAHGAVLHRRLPPAETTAREGDSVSSRVQPLLSFGAWMTLSNLISPLMVTADRFVVSALLGAAAVAYYTVPFDFLLRLLVLPAALTSALFPHLSSLAQTNAAGFRKTYRSALRVVFLGMAPLCLAIAIGSHWALGLWLDPTFAEKSWAVASWMAVGLLFNAIAQVPHAALQAQGGVKITALLHLAESLVYFPLLIGALVAFGITGAAVAWVVRALADLLLLSYFARTRS